MARSFDFAVIRFAPNDVRDERVNIGVAVRRDGHIDVRLAKNLEKVKVISGGVDTAVLRELISSLQTVFQSEGDEQSCSSGPLDFRCGPIAVASSGSFTTDDDLASYEARLETILKRLVEAEPGHPKVRIKRSRIKSELKSIFRKERVLAAREDSLDSHRILADFTLSDGLVADLVLQNGAFHVVETVEAPGDDSSIKRMIADVAVSALVFERAKMQFGGEKTRARLIYHAAPAIEKAAQSALETAEHQGAELINWASLEDRTKFISSLTLLARPLEKKSRVMISDELFARRRQGQLH